jgi:hypothetical protein
MRPGNRTSALIVASIYLLLGGAHYAFTQVPVEPVPEVEEFDMWNTESFSDDAIGLPPEPTVGPPPTEGDFTSPDASASNESDPCRHFSEAERQALPLLCGTNQ